MNAISSILKGINDYVPLREFLNYIFKTKLSDFLIVNNVNIDNIEKDISSKSFLLLSNLLLNTSNINNTFLLNSPIKVINGKIGKLSITILENNKISISIEKIIITLMPLFTNRYKQSNLNINHKNEKNILKEKKNEEEIKKKGSFINNIINNLLNNVEIYISNICIHTMTYEANDITLNNPVFTFYLLNFKCSNNQNIKNNFFLNGMNGIANYICMKIDKNLNITDEQEFMNLNPKNQNFEIDIFKFFKNENTIFAINYKNNPSILLSISKKENRDDLNIKINIERLEFILSPIQLFYIRIFFQIVGSIFRAKTNIKTQPIQQKEEKENNEEESLEILDTKIKNFIIGLNTERFIFVLYENQSSPKTKLFSFYNKDYGIENFQSFENIEKHFCYNEDNFIIFGIKKINYSSDLMILINEINFHYINFRGKHLAISNINIKQNTDSSIYQSASSENDSIYKSLPENYDYIFEEYKQFISQKGDFDYCIYDIILIDKLKLNPNKNEIYIKDLQIKFHFIIIFILIKLSFQNDKFPHSYNNVEMDSSSIFFNSFKSKPLLKEKEENKINEKNTIYKIIIDKFSMKIYNFVKDKTRDDMNEYYYIYHLKNIIPYYSEGLKKKTNNIIDLDSIISKEFVNIQLSEIDISLSSPQLEVKMLYKELNMFYNNYQVLSYSVISNENDLISYKLNNNDHDICINFPYVATFHIEYSIIYELLEFSNTFLFSFSMIQIVNTFINDIYVNKLLNLFEMYGINFYSNKQMDPQNNSSKIYVKANINDLIIMFNNNNTIDENDGNIFKIEFLNTNISLLMESENPDNKVNISMDDMKFFIKKNNSKDKYYLLLSKLPTEEFLKIPLINIDIIFQMFPKEDNLDIIQEEENEENLKINNILNENINSYYSIYQKFLLTHQVPMKNMSLNISFNISNIFIYSIYNDFKNINLTLKNLMLDLSNNENKNQEDIILIPINEDRKIDLEITFSLMKIYHDIFYQNEDVTNDKWMRMIIVINSIIGKKNESENSIEMNNLFLYFLKDFTYKEENENNYNITNAISYIENENSYLKRVGYTEILFNDNISINQIKERYTINIQNFQIYLCKDTFISIQDFFNELNEQYFTHLKIIFPSEKKINNKSKDSKEKEEEKKVENDEKKKEENEEEKNIEKKKSQDEIFGFHIVEDYLIETICPEGKKKEEKPNLNKTIKAKNKNELYKIEEENYTLCYEFVGREKSIQNLKRLNEENEENIDKMKIKLNIDSIRIYLYKGKNFSFESDGGIIKHNKENKLNEKIEIDENYLIDDDFEQEYKILPKRKRKKTKNYQSYIEINLMNLSLLMEPTKIKLSLMNFDINDHIEGSKFSKIISKYDFKNTNNDILTMNIDIQNQYVECNMRRIYDLNVNISSINVLIDQLSLLFILKFFEIKLKIFNEEEINKEGDEIFNSKIEIPQQKKDEINFFLQNILINSFNVNFSYNSHKLSLNKLVKLDYKELINITNITDFKIEFKKYFENNLTPFELGCFNIIDFWKDDIIKHQLTNAVIHSIAFLRPFVTIYEGFTGIFKQPFISYKKNEGVKKGIKKGFFNFFSSFTSQSLFLGEKMFRGIKRFLNFNTSMSLGKDSLYKQWMYRFNEEKRGYDRHFVKK